MNTETENRGKSTIKYRWTAIRASWNEGPWLRDFFVFLLNILAFLVILLPALLFLPCDWGLNYTKGEMRDIYARFNAGVDDRRDGLPEFLADIIAFIFCLCLGLIFLVLGLPFLILYWSYRFIDKLSKRPVFKILVLLTVLGVIAFYVFRYFSHKVEQGQVDATTEMAR